MVRSHDVSGLREAPQVKAGIDHPALLHKGSTVALIERRILLFSEGVGERQDVFKRRRCIVLLQWLAGAQ